MPKKKPEEQEELELEEFDMEDMEDMDDGEEESSFEVDGDVLERIAKALETIAKVLVDREAKFASRPPRTGGKPGFGDRDRGPRRSFDDDGDAPRKSFSKPGYGEKSFRSGPGVGFSDRPRGGDRGGFGGKPAGKGGFGAGPRGGKPSGGPKGRSRF